jgi:periplasmic protein TonB
MSAIMRNFNASVGFSGANRLFGVMMTLSLLLHLLAFIPLLLQGHGRVAGPQAPFLDLNMGMVTRSAPTTEPAKRPVSGDVEAPGQSQPKQVSLSELDRLRDNAQRSLAGAASQPDSVEDASLGLSITRGYFASIGEGETLRDDIREYYFEILRRINEKWWVNGDNQPTGRKRAVFYLVIARNGTILDRMMVESSGNTSYDRAMLKTLEASGPLPPLPESYRGDFFQAPLRFNVPLNLLKSLKLKS